MKKEYGLVFAIGLFILAYVLDAVVKPLAILLPSPYHYFTPITLSLYPFSTTSIILKAIAVWISILLGISFIEKPLAKGGTLILISGLLQLYTLQDVATRTHLLPLEWSLALTLTGILLILPSLGYIVMGILLAIHHSFNPYEATGEEGGASGQT